MALAYLLHQSKIDLLGITTVTGESVRRAMLADAMCRLAGKRIPIYPGCETPILGPLLQSRVNPEEAAQTARFPHAEQFPRCRALEFLRENIEAYPHEIVLAAIGPLTNIGLLFAAYPHLPGLLKALVVMGGRFFHTADFDTKKWGHVEWNIKGDPYAASIVFSAPVPALYATGVEKYPAVSEFRAIARPGRSRPSPAFGPSPPLSSIGNTPGFTIRWRYGPISTGKRFPGRGEIFRYRWGMHWVPFIFRPARPAPAAC